jgi:hypothetical protein
MSGQSDWPGSMTCLFTCWLACLMWLQARMSTLRCRPAGSQASFFNAQTVLRAGWAACYGSGEALH